MKSAFKILPEAGVAAHMNLLIELGWNNLSFAYYEGRQVLGLQVYHFDKNLRANALCDVLKKFLVAENFPAFTRVDICYNFQECSVIPSQFYQPANATEMLDCVHMQDKFSDDMEADLPGLSAKLLYRVPTCISQLMKEYFPQASVTHTQAKLLPSLIKTGNTIYCDVQQNVLEIAFLKDGKLQLINYFDFTVPSDVVYLLLNICAQHNIAAQDVTIALSGFIDEKSNLYTDISRYFEKVQFKEPYNADIAGPIQQYPLHFFSHLISLFQCAS